MLDCPRCGAQLLPEFAACPNCHLPVVAMPEAGGGDEAVATIVPYKNPSALLAYYLGLFGVATSCVPLIGLGLSIAAVVLGIRGRRHVRAHPEAHGTAHAWFGLIAGGLGILVGGLVLIAIAFALAAALLGTVLVPTSQAIFLPH